MKKGLLILLSLLIVTCVFAFDKGTINPGGTISFTSSKSHSDADAYTALLFAPQIGYFVIDNLSADLDLSLVSEKQGDDKASMFGIGIGARYFYNNFYGGLGLMMNSYKSEYTSGTYTYEFKQTASFLNLKAGYVVPIVENVFVDAGLNYQMGFGEYGGGASGDNEESALTIGAGLQVFFPFMK
jgi:hypothetical protein